MLNYTDPTYIIIDSTADWHGEERYGTFKDACDAAKEASIRGSRMYYVARIEAQTQLESSVVDIYGATWR